MSNKPPTVQIEADFPFNAATAEFCRVMSLWASHLNESLNGGVSLKLMGFGSSSFASFNWRGRVIAAIFLYVENPDFYYMAGSLKFNNFKDAFNKVFRPQIMQTLKDMHFELDWIRRKVDNKHNII